MTSALVLAMANIVFMDASLAGSNSSSGCVKTARQLLRACQFDVRDDINVTNANCTNISDPAERRACRDEARRTKLEERALCGDQRDARLEVCELLGEDRYDPDPLLDPAIFA